MVYPEVGALSRTGACHGARTGRGGTRLASFSEADDRRYSRSRRGQLGATVLGQRY